MPRSGGDVVHHCDMLGRRKRNDSGEPKSPSNAYAGLRAMALGAVGGSLYPPSDDHPNVSGVVVDVPAQGGYATFVALADNTTSMYTSVGGGTIGAGEQQNVAQATQQLLGVVEAHLSFFVEPDDQSLPSGGFVRFHLLSPTGPRRVDIVEDAFWGRVQNPLMPVIAATQQVIAAIRSVSPGSA
jgi:hypothetical protein